jgi:filamentous hemagglutinin
MVLISLTAFRYLTDQNKISSTTPKIETSVKSTNVTAYHTSIDDEEITPETWRGLKLEMRKDDGSIAKIGLLRPLWWLKKANAKAGGTINLSMPEMGIVGEAKVISINPCTVDSRNSKPNENVVTGTFAHENAIVLDLGFNNDPKSNLGVTHNHPIWSTSRNTWIEAGELKIGEHVKTEKGVAMLTKRSQRKGRHKVYNLEVHKTHTYYVSNLNILVHNSCAIISDGKFDYIFGNARGIKNASHNLPRTRQNAFQMKRLGLVDDASSRTLLKRHFGKVVNDNTNIIKSYSNKYGNFEVRESLFAGPSGKFSKFESTWEILNSGNRRMTTVIPFGGMK